MPRLLGLVPQLVPNLAAILHRRYLVPADLTVGQFVYVIRKRIKVSPEKAIFMFVKNTLPPTGASASAGPALCLLVRAHAPSTSCDLSHMPT